MCTPSIIGGFLQRRTFKKRRTDFNIINGILGLISQNVSGLSSPNYLLVLQSQVLII